MPTPQARRRRLILGTMAGVAVGLVVVMVLAMLIRTWTLTDTIRGTQIEGTPLGKRLLDQAERIESCTTAGETCYEEQQRKTAGAISDINKITLYAAACADRSGQQTVEQIQGCVIAKLAAEDRRKQ